MGTALNMRELVAKVTCDSARGTGFVVGRGRLAAALHVVADSLYSPPNAFERMAAFRPWLQLAWKTGDRAAGALLDALDGR